MIETNNTRFHDKCLTKVSWQKEGETWSEDLDPVVTGTEWVTWTYTSPFMPWCFKASTVEEAIKVAHRMKFGQNPMGSLTPQEDGSFLVTVKHDTFRVIVEQETYKPRQKSLEEYEEEMADFQNDLERDLALL